MGNTVIVITPQDPLAIIKLGEVLNEVFPPGVVNVIVGSSPEVGAALVDSKDVNMISFTEALRSAPSHGSWKTMSFLWS